MEVSPLILQLEFAMSTRNSILAVLVFSLMSAAAWTSTGRAMHRPDSTSSVRAKLTLAGACANECAHYACALTTYHANGSGSSNYGPTHGCEGPYTDSCPHPMCGGETDDLLALADRTIELAPGDLDGLRAVLQRKNVQINLERSALQFVSPCNGEVAAQVELDRDIAEELAATIQAND